MSDFSGKIEIVDTILVEVESQGPTGPQGPPGPAGASTLSLTAAIAIGGHRLVTTDASGHAIYADATIPTHANCVVGMSIGAAASGATVSVQSSGELSDPSFSYTPGQVLFLGSDGLVATNAPTSGFSLVIGYAETATTIFLNIGQPIKLA